MVATQQSFSISRRALDVEDYIDIARRHAGWIVGPALFGTVVAICIAFTLQNKYISSAEMQITPPQISSAMVATTISNALNDRIQQMEQQILSQRSLGGIITDPHLNLYKDELKSDKVLEDVVDEMKSNITIQFVSLPGALGNRASAFMIAFKYPDRIKAQQVVQALISKFQAANQTTQKTDQDQTKSLVGDLSKNAKADLQDADEKLTKFRLAHEGKLPENVQLNIAREAGYTEKLRGVTEQIFRDNQYLAQLQTAKDQEQGTLEFYEQEQAQIRNSLNGPNAIQQNPELASLDKTIENMEFNIQTLEKQFSDAYPGIKNAKKQLESFKSKREELAKKVQAKLDADAAKAADEAGKPKTPDTATSVRDAEVQHQVQQKIKDIEASESLYKQDIARLTAEQESYKKASAQIDEMLRDSTGLEAEYADLIRNHNLADANYQQYLTKQKMAEAEGELIDRNAGETLEVLDNASLPNAPVEPNRTKIIGVGFAMSLILGLGMAGLQEAKDTSLKNLKDVRAYTHLPVLCSVPLLENTMLVKRKRRLTYLAWSAAVLVGAAAVSASVVYYMTVINAAKG